jgi:MinD-like ATPase involved in chromosome partitioning or flagellar assembly
MNSKQSVIVTFYSYKGGVGRSMSLANVAWLLANKYGKKVLLVDWDLEAPGLHRFFNIGNKTIKGGLLELLDEYKTVLKEATESLPKQLVNIDKYITQIPLLNAKGDGSLSLIAAGQQDSTYAGRVNQFDWDEFYEKWHGSGFFEYLKEELKSRAEIILLDSRTGVTDIGGICTLQLPDVVVLLFALNEQSIAGVEFIADSILSKSSEVVKREAPPILIVRPARVEKYLEQDKKNEWEIVASRRLEQYLLPEERKDSLRTMKETAIPYIGAYSFGETPLAVDKDPHETLAKSFESLTKSVLRAASMWTEDEVEQDEFKERLYLSRRRFTYFLSTWIFKNKLLTTSLLIALLSMPLALSSYQRLREAELESQRAEEQRKLLEQELNQRSQSLEDSVRQLQKQNQDLADQNKMLDYRVDKLLDQLAAGNRRPR